MISLNGIMSEQQPEPDSSDEDCPVADAQLSDVTSQREHASSDEGGDDVKPEASESNVKDDDEDEIKYVYKSPNECTDEYVKMSVMIVMFSELFERRQASKRGSPYDLPAQRIDPYGFILEEEGGVDPMSSKQYAMLLL